MFTFEPENRLIILDFGVTSVDVLDMYSAWKVWVTESDNAKWPRAISVTGGETTIGSDEAPTYGFMENSWKVRPHEANHTLIVQFNLSSRDGSNPFVKTLGGFTVIINNRLSDSPRVSTDGQGSVIVMGNGMDWESIRSIRTSDLLISKINSSNIASRLSKTTLTSKVEKGYSGVIKSNNYVSKVC